jgi:carboxymethylenebutenolidase
VYSTHAQPRGTVLVIHENRGLTDHIKNVAGRLAASGFAALALDLLSEEGGTGKYTDPAQATAALNAAPPGRFVADMQAAVGELQRRVPGKKTAAMGFCFGGGMIWQLLAAGEPRLAAAAPFYGPLPGRADGAEDRRSR